jgi:hypothetical protein
MNKLISNNFNSIHIGGTGNGTTTSINPPGLLAPNGGSNNSQIEPHHIYYNSNFLSKSLISNNNNFQPQG